MLASFVYAGYSQNNNNTNAEPTCYELWAKVFDARGAYEIADGEHDNVIIAIKRTDGSVDCFMGKVEVSGKNLAKLYRKLVDNSYEIFEPVAKYPKIKIDVAGGISKALQTVDSELVYVIFVNHLKPKKVDYQKAPLPNPDDY